MSAGSKEYDIVAFEDTYQGTDEDGNNFVCIDGYPEDENAEGEVVVMVYCTPHGDLVVDWHDNGLRGNETVLEMVQRAKESLTEEYREGKKQQKNINIGYAE